MGYIYTEENASARPIPAAKELQRYFYTRKGELPKLAIMKNDGELPQKSILMTMLDQLKNEGSAKRLKGDGYLIKSTEDNGSMILVGSDCGALYGVYEFIESLGVGLELKGDIIPDTIKVKTAYPVLHSNAGDSTWANTSDYNFGASQIFESDVYGADYMKGVSEWPRTKKENIAIFDKVGALPNFSFILARQLGVKTCLGTETPLTIPYQERQRLAEKGSWYDSA